MKSVPVESTCGCKEASCKDDCSRNHTHKTFSCKECSVPVEKLGMSIDDILDAIGSTAALKDREWRQSAYALLSQAIQSAKDEESERCYREVVKNLQLMPQGDGKANFIEAVKQAIINKHQ